MSTKHSESSEKLHPITFCTECNEAIPARALACFHCGAKQNGGSKALRVIFCEKCGEDFPAQAHACFHCGHVNPKSRYLAGQVTDSSVA